MLARASAAASAAWQAPALALALRRVSGLAARDESEVLGTCGAEPYSESFRENSLACDDLVAGLEAGARPEQVQYKL